MRVAILCRVKIDLCLIPKTINKFELLVNVNQSFTYRLDPMFSAIKPMCFKQ